MSLNRRSGTFRSGRIWLGTKDAPEITGILEEARNLKATDVHIMAHSPVYFRLDGQLTAFSPEVLSASAARHLACALLSEPQLAALDETLDLDFMCTDANQRRYRVNVGYFNGAVGATIRLLPNNPMPLEMLGLPAVVEQMTHRTKGLILIPGSTSQGKTTTMASMIDAINRHSRKHIITIEDPIEVLHPRGQSLVRQREVGRDTKSFASGLRAALRQDPDVVMIGEMRDAETIETALRAAEVGVLVLSTLPLVSIEQLVGRILPSVPRVRARRRPADDELVARGGARRVGDLRGRVRKRREELRQLCLIRSFAGLRIPTSPPTPSFARDFRRHSAGSIASIV